jgi:hypothetical protein
LVSTFQRVDQYSAQVWNYYQATKYKHSTPLTLFNNASHRIINQTPRVLSVSCVLRSILLFFVILNQLGNMMISLTPIIHWRFGHLRLQFAQNFHLNILSHFLLQSVCIHVLAHVLVSCNREKNIRENNKLDASQRKVKI